jgi:ubiquinone biosynthesis protein
MLKKRRIPTPLLDAAQKPKVELVPSKPPSVFRSLSVIAMFTRMAWDWVLAGLPQRAQGKDVTAVRGRMMRLTLQRLGGLWIKTGQLLAMRRDLFPEGFCRELSLLQDRVQGFPASEVRQIIRDDLQRDLEGVFSEFDEEPLGAASIGQVHRARLRYNNVVVAVKIQRPHIAESFAYDLVSIKRLIGFIKLMGLAPYVRWDEMLTELQESLADELDYRMEASSLEKMRKKLRDHKVYVPNIFMRFSTRRVLIMEFIRGVPMADYIQMAEKDPERLKDWLKENNIKPKRLGQKLYFTHVRQVFEDNQFHGDLHPGNIMLLRDSRIALIDFGAVGTFEQTLRIRYRQIYNAVSMGEYHKVADLFLLLGPALPVSLDIEEVRAEISRVLRGWEARAAIKNLPYHDKSLTTAMGQIARVTAKHQIPSTWDFMRLNRSELTLDASLMYLLPEMNYPKMARRYDEQARRRAAKAAQSKKAIARQMSQLQAAAEMPAILAENISMEAELIRKKARNFQARITRAGHMAGFIFGMIGRGTLLVAVLAVGALLRDHEVLRGGPLQGSWLESLLAQLPVLERGVWLLLLLLSLYLSRAFLGLAKRTSEKEQFGQSSS